jgi:hypothetical protein
MPYPNRVGIYLMAAFGIPGSVHVLYPCGKYRTGKAHEEAQVYRIQPFNISKR